MKLNQYLREDKKLDEGSTADATNMEMAIVQAWNMEKAKYPHLEPVAQNVAKMFKGWGFKQGRDKAEHLGDSSKFTVTKDWSKYGAKNPTPKTDFLISRAKISLKKSGGSQLMSGGESETLATFHAAIKQLQMDGAPVVNKIDEYVHKFINIKTPQTVTDTRKSGGEAADKLMTTEQVHKEFGSFLKKYFEDNHEFKNAVVHEAMSGQVKFGDKSKARARFILVFDAKKGIDNKWHKIDDPSFIAQKAQNTRVHVNWKSMKRYGKYNIYSVLRLATNETKRLMDEHEFLTEGIISDISAKVKDFMKRVWIQVRAWLSESMNNVLEFLGFQPIMTPITIKY